MSLLTALHLAEKVTVPVPHPLAYAGADAPLGRGPGRGSGRVRGLRAFPVRGRRGEGPPGPEFTPRYGSREALRAFLAYRYPEAAGVEAEASL